MLSLRFPPSSPLHQTLINDHHHHQNHHHLHWRCGRGSTWAPLQTDGVPYGLPEGLMRERMPRHVAMIMDGNGRWAMSRGLPVSAGHQAGFMALKETVRLSCRWGIPFLTVFAFSDDNWLRSEVSVEVDFLLRLFEGVLRENIEEFVRALLTISIRIVSSSGKYEFNVKGDSFTSVSWMRCGFLKEGIRFSIIGDSSKLPKTLQDLANYAVQITRNNSRLGLSVAMSYSGRNDIVQACKKIAQKVKDGLLQPEDITELIVAQSLETNNSIDCPYPDLLIRTSGELRLSNFLLWQSAYTELFFAQSLWPDFGEAEYLEALHAFQNRKRRFGRRVAEE
ncbi:Dehydrodolichyl diphosphate synthase 2 [Acorus calamus]|uniref:Alkyl transferase n=1 Tax=Acorus calamus TaxID=4465 RepID=A0AAV9DE91_ACOCL|nr:Dehydrodolichyl diphosphate synthase 2 [Acorus calamus]